MRSSPSWQGEKSHRGTHSATHRRTDVARPDLDAHNGGHAPRTRHPDRTRVRPMAMRKCCLPLACLAWAGVVSSPFSVAEDPPARPVTPEILETQLTLRIEPLQGRATV